MATGELWAFSLRFYARPGVAAACLALQDRCGADVGLLLHLLHLAASARSVTQCSIATLDAAVSAWRKSVVVPLRGVRRALKSPPEHFAGAAALRQRVKDVELEAEQLEQALLEQSNVPTEACADSLAAATASLAAYLAALGQPPDAAADLLTRFADFCTDERAK